MGFLTPYTSPKDPRWQGIQSWHHKVFLVKNVVLILFLPLVIVEGVLFTRWWTSESYKLSADYSPYSFLLRIGMSLIPDFVITIIDFIFIPMQWGSPTSFLVCDFIVFALYVNTTWLNWAILYSREVSFKNQDTWDDLCMAEMSVQAVLAVCWFVMFVFACHATRKWTAGRQERKEARYMPKNVGRASEHERV